MLLITATTAEPTAVPGLIAITARSVIAESTVSPQSLAEAREAFTALRDSVALSGARAIVASRWLRGSRAPVGLRAALAAGELTSYVNL